MTTTIDTHVHRWVPAERDGLPTLLLLHGTGGDESDLLQLGRLLVPGAAMLSPRGNVSEHGAPRFFRRLAEGVFDVDDLHARTTTLHEWVGAAEAAYGFDRSRLYAVGFSNGANVAASLMLSHPGSIAGAVLIRAMIPFTPTNAPALAGTRVLISEGRMDPIVPAEQAEGLASIFREAGAEVELVWQMAGHGLVQGDVAAAQRFFGQG